MVSVYSKNLFLIVRFFFNDTATTEIYTLSLHDALPINTQPRKGSRACSSTSRAARATHPAAAWLDRKSTRLNSSHTVISYAVFCLKKKKKIYKLYTWQQQRTDNQILCQTFILSTDAVLLITRAFFCCFFF